MRRAVLLIYVVAGFGCVCSRFFLEPAENSFPALTKTIRRLVRGPDVQDVLLVNTDFRVTERQRLVNDIVARSVLPLRPTIIVGMKNGTAVDPGLKIKTTDRTIAIIVYGPGNDPRKARSEWAEIIYTLINAASHQTFPKIQLVLVPDGLPFDYRGFFKFFFDTRMINVSLLEVLDRDGTLYLVVHENNPYQDSYSRRILEDGQHHEPFPDKLRDLYGKRIKVEQLIQEPYFMIRNGTDNRTVKEGMSFAYLDGLKVATNGTIEWTNHSQLLDMHNRVLCLSGTTGKLLHSITVGSEKMCGCMSIIRKRRGITAMDLLPVILSSLLILWIFWLVQRLLGIEWPLLVNVFNLLVGLGAETVPVSLTGRVMFLSLVAVITRYSAMFYTEVFDLAVGGSEELNVTSFEDIERAGLNMFLSNDSVNNVLRYADIPAKLLERTRIMGNETEYSMAARDPRSFRNNITFMMEFACMYYVRREPGLKMSEFCPSSCPLVYYFPKKSFYANRFNYVFLRVQESGLVGYYEIQWTIREQFLNHKPSGTIDESSSSVEESFMKYAAIGYALSILILIGEILLNWTRKRRARIDRSIRADP